jgi:predicted transcriptional regulator
MRTTVSIPDEVFERAELFALWTKRSSSQLYGDALDKYLKRHSGDEVKDGLNRALDAAGDSTDEFPSAASRRRLASMEW